MNMELLKEFEFEKIQLFVDDKNNVHDLKIRDLRDNETYTLEDLIGSKIEIKNYSIIKSNLSFWEGHDLILYSVNGNEYKIDLYNFRCEITAKKVETTLTKLFNEFVANSQICCIGEHMSVNEKKQTIRDTVEEAGSWWYFKKGSDGRFYFCSGPREAENSADDFETAVIKYLNEKESTAQHNRRMDVDKGGRPDPDPRKCLNRDR
ncbi:MAG: hypothetical protein K6E51_10060 [Treponema sp.]|nr:hypothetical protein [Treponema sp.]